MQEFSSPGLSFVAEHLKFSIFKNLLCVILAVAILLGKLEKGLRSGCYH